MKTKYYPHWKEIFVRPYGIAHTCEVGLLPSICVLVEPIISFTRLEQWVQGKETMERELYSRFVTVLNEKKAKIRDLQDTLRQLQDNHREERGRSALYGFLESLRL